MKTKDIIRIQHSIYEAIDFIATNGDGDETGITNSLIDELYECKKILQKEKERIYLNDAKRKLKLK